MTDSKSPGIRLVGFFAVLFLVAGAAIALGGSDDTSPNRSASLGDVRLVSFASCDDLLEWYRSVATETDADMLGGYGGVLYDTGAMGGDDMAVARDGAATTVAAAPQQEAAPGAATGGDSFSGTNVQERDVDEPDTVKTNGEIIVSVRYSTIEIVDVRTDEPELISTVDLEEGGTEILLSGDRLLALTNVWREDPSASADQPVTSDDEAARIMIAPVSGRSMTLLTAIDISDPADPQVVETSEIPGMYRSARATDGTARIVIVNTPQLPMPGPAVYDSPDQTVIEQRLEEWKTEAIASMTLEDWSPTTGSDCSSVTRTSQPEGLSTTTIITLDLDGSLEQLDSDAVVADAGTVYASTDRLLIATSRWSQTSQPQGAVSTELHSFDISDGASTSYVGSGAVDGYLLNQFALSAKDGYVRVATTVDGPWSEETEVQATDNALAVLQEQGDQLVEVGRVDGLGPTERIQAVRYFGDVAYVVTFRQTDPLYAIDLSDPTNPRVAGELKIPGYSAYLHPIDDDRLLGVGQDATDEGQTLGTQLATFDITDLASTVRIDTIRIDGASSMVEYDHKAFLWWAATRNVVVPIEIYPQLDCPPDADCLFTEEQSRPFMGAVSFTIGEDGSIVEAGRVTHDGRGELADGWYPIIRSIVVGDSLYTISEAGILKSDLASLADGGFAQFPAPEQQDFVEPLPVEGDGGIGDGSTSPGSAGEPAPDVDPATPETTLPEEG